MNSANLQTQAEAKVHFSSESHAGSRKLRRPTRASSAASRSQLPANSPARRGFLQFSLSPSGHWHHDGDPPLERHHGAVHGSSQAGPGQPASERRGWLNRVLPLGPDVASPPVCRCLWVPASSGRPTAPTWALVFTVSSLGVSVTVASLGHTVRVLRGVRVGAVA